MTGILAAFSTAAQPPRTIRSASEIFFPPDCAPLNSFWIPSRVVSTVFSCAGSLTSQSFCGARRMRAPFAPPRMSEPRNVDADAQAVETSSRTDRPDARILSLRAAMSLRVDEFVVDRRHRVLPDQLLRRDLRAEVARARTHVAVGQLEPRPGEGVRELLGVLQIVARDRLVDRVEA